MSDAITPPGAAGPGAAPAAAALLTDRAVAQVLPAAPPAVREAARLALAPWAEKLVRFLDDGLKIPGTKFGIGVDPIVGMVIPGAGDVITGTGSIALLFVALQKRVPTVILARMLLNIAIDTAVGVIPFVGDAFDFFFRSNRKNLAMIEKYQRDSGHKPGVADYLIVATGVFLSVVSILSPFVLGWVLGMMGIAGLSWLFGGD
jgi:hypothetical protein